ncbi:MAG: 1-acyl-sn-glycerol-3-phosphate acyltransferase [Acidimicrobiaceae bacterium]|jgi:1-acyl-sn-glycerol-3-phosphate acyltransferase
MAVGERQRWWEVGLYRFVRALILGVAKLFGRIEVIGDSNVPRDRPFVLAPVHRSNVDFALVSLVTKRRMRYMGKDSIFKFKVLNPFFHALGAFPVHRGAADREALRTSIAVIESGQPLVMFPEGTRQSGPVVQELFDGTAYVAAKANVPIVPVGIGGSEAAMPKGSKMIRPAKLVLVVGQPLEPPAPRDGGGTSRRAVKELTEQLHAELQKLFDEAETRAGRR